MVAGKKNVSSATTKEVYSMNGSHLTADCYSCDFPLSDKIAIIDICTDAIKTNGLHIVGESWVKFPDWEGHPGGVTGALVLSESHLAIHTWPETGNVTLDIYVCNFTQDNSQKARDAMDQIIGQLKAKRVLNNQINRGDIK